MLRSKNKSYTRRIFSVCLFVAFLALPYWVYIPLVIIGIIWFPFYIEAVVAGFLIDVLYGGMHELFFGFPFIFALFAAVLVGVALPLRDQIRLSDV